MDDQTPSQIGVPATRAGRRSAAHLVLSRRSGYGVAHRRAAIGRDGGDGGGGGKPEPSPPAAP